MAREPTKAEPLRLPISPEEALADLMKVPPPPDKKRRGGKAKGKPQP